jgi:hypothetical protein
VIDQEPLPTDTQHDNRLQFRTQSVGHGESRARVDTVALRLQRLGAILDQHDPDALREWRLSQMAQLGIGDER